MAIKASKLPPLYCKHCGGLMLNRFMHSHFDTSNGKEVFTVYSRCPKKQRFFDRHDGFWRYVEYPSGDKTLMFYEDGSQVI